MRTRVRNALVVSEVTLALVLLTGAGLLIKSFWRLLEVRPGFNPEKILVATIDLPEARYREPHQQTQFVQRLIERLGSLRDVRRAAVSAGLPFSDVSDAGIRIDGRLVGTPESGAPANYYRVTPLYFQAIRYWQDEDSGHWEERRKIEASSIGAVVAGLRELRLLREIRGC